MSKEAIARRAGSNDELIASIADSIRRETLVALRDRRGAVTTGELATVVTAAVTGDDLVDVSRVDRDPLHVELVHRHLPKLADVGLVDRDEDGTVTLTDDPALGDERFRGLLDVDADDWDQVLAALQSTRRRLALSVLESADELDRRELARRVVARENDVPPTAVPERELEDALVALHHVHLPTLQEANLVAYDDQRVRYVDRPDLQSEWLDRDVTGADTDRDEPDVQTVDGRAEDVRTIDGRENVVARGQGLFDDADDELFLMITTDGLLAPECVSRLQDAVDRGVDVYVGSQTRAVRDLVREEVPGATIWEPQLDWLNLPPNRERLGRLVLADREAVMLGTLGEASDGGYRETAVTGEGERNSLVVLLRELLGSRLDHLDAQSEDFRSQIPL